MNTLRLALLLAAIMTMTGCATMSEEECLTSDWRTVGYEDGLMGKSGTAIGTYRKACAKAGVQPDFDAYQAGRSEGLEEFCRPQNGYRLGERGAAYHGVCPAHAEPSFMIAYEDGRTLYELRSDVNRLQSELASTEREIDSIEQSIEVETLNMISEGLTAQERLHILSQTKQLAERKGELEDRLEYLAEELGASRERLDDYQQMQASN
ncbi:MAG: DUF2799 domain-containing protein [Pseudomonadota bacterium]